jgi:hypothetical protein
MSGEELQVAVDEMHQAFYSSLQSLFDSHRHLHPTYVNATLSVIGA